MILPASSFRHLQTGWRRHSFAALRFYGAYFRWPLLFVLVAVAGEKLTFYGLLPLGGYLRRDLAFYEASRAYTTGRDQAALVSIRQALLQTRDDARLWVLAAKISDRLDSPEAAYCWHQADRVQPDSVEIQLAWAEAALHQGQLDQASIALSEAASAGPPSLRYLLDAGELARASGEVAEARLFFQRVETRQPTDLQMRWKLAEWHADSKDPAELAQAHELLLRLLPHYPNRSVILRKLLEVELKQGDLHDAQIRSDALLRRPDASLEDRVRSLDLAKATGTLDRDLAGVLRTSDRELASAVLGWMANHGRARAALIWIREQDETWQEAPAIGEARAACLSSLGDWEHLRDDQRDSLWLGDEPKRLMLLAEASLALHNENDAIAAWHQAVASSRTVSDLMAMVKCADRLRVSYPWDAERAEIWEALTARCPTEEWPLQLLLTYQLSRGDLVQAQALEARLTDLVPDDPEIRANYDLILLLRGEQTEKASLNLQQLEARAPTDPPVATAAAYALYLQGSFSEALSILGGLRAADLQAPERAAYLGQLLAAAGPVDQAESTLRRALGQPALLPEQQHGIEQSLDLVAYRRAMAALLHPATRGEQERARTLFTWRAQTGASLFVMGKSVALHADPAASARALANVEPASLNRTELSIYTGSVLELEGHPAQATAYLELSRDLPPKNSREKLRVCLEMWWSLWRAAPGNADLARGLFATYRGLENEEAAAAFWQQDAPRELRLTGDLLHRGLLAAEVQNRMERLGRHLLSTPEMQIQLAYAYFLQSREAASQSRLKLIAPEDLRKPEFASFVNPMLESLQMADRSRSFGQQNQPLPEIIKKPL